MGKEKKKILFSRGGFVMKMKKNASTSLVAELEQKILHLQPKNL